MLNLVKYKRFFINNYYIEKIYIYDKYNKIINGEILYNLIINNKNAGTMSLRLSSGQICNMNIIEKYRHFGFGIELLQNATMDRISYNNNPEIFAVTIKNHLFWSNIKYNQYYEKNIYHNISGGGYKINLL